MITFPDAKINLGLNIVERRADGYHNLETVFYPIPLCDALELTPLPCGARTLLEQSGSTTTADPEDNLALKAYRLLQRKGYALPPLKISLCKRTPSGAGLGGGSADAAYMLRMLNELAELGLTTAELEALAAELGADCPFFIADRPSFATGIGELLQPIELSLKGYRLVLVKPDVFVSTREAFSHVVPRKPEVSPREVVGMPVGQWRGLLTNDFEESVFSLHPEIGELKQSLYDSGALYASMSGSGSSVFALYDGSCEVRLPEFGPGSFVFDAVL